MEHKELPTSQTPQEELDSHFQKRVQHGERLIANLGYSEEDMTRMSNEEFITKVIRPLSQQARGES